MITSPRNRIALWIAAGVAEPQCREIHHAVQLRDGEARRFDGADTVDTAVTDAGAVTLQIVDPLDGVLAVAYVGESSGGQVALNGVPLGSGMHPLRATDRLDVGADSYWLSEDLTPQRTRYDPDQHGPDARCCMTKARLQAGQDIVICPGRPGVPCAIIYKAAAWDAVMQSGRGMKCPNCGYQPQQAAWSPPAPRLRRKLFDEYYQFALQ